jgi:hypothetical protein
MPPSADAAAAIGPGMPFSPASKTTKPPACSSRRRRTFIVRINPPRSSHTPSATGSGGLQASRRRRRRERMRAGRAEVIGAHRRTVTPQSSRRSWRRSSRRSRRPRAGDRPGLHLRARRLPLRGGTPALRKRPDRDAAWRRSASGTTGDRLESVGPPPRRAAGPRRRSDGQHGAAGKATRTRTRRQPRQTEARSRRS